MNRPALTLCNNVFRGLAGGSASGRSIFDAVEAGTFVPSPRGDGRYTLPQLAKVTAAEAGVLQSFRPDYPWTGPTVDALGRQIGNAVPPLLGAAVIKELLT